MAMIVAPPLRPAGWVVIKISIALVFFYLSIVPHELGHALAARLLGWRVFKISLGLGRTVVSRKLAGLRFELNTWPVGGVAWFGSPTIAFYRTKLSLIVLAGPFMNLVLTGALFFSLYPDHSFSAVRGSGLEPLFLLLYANAALVVGRYCLIAPQLSVARLS
jgi:membrane-associated protease RseP (regulator of RpoE activity)